MIIIIITIIIAGMLNDNDSQVTKASFLALYVTLGSVVPVAMLSVIVVILMRCFAQREYNIYTVRHKMRHFVFDYTLSFLERFLRFYRAACNTDAV